jgi:hypothetical protein
MPNIILDNPHFAFQDIVTAIMEYNAERLDEYNMIWESVRDHFDECQKCKDYANTLSDDLKPTLILWLSTSSALKSVEWDETVAPSFIIESRNQVIKEVEWLWECWRDDRIKTQIRNSLGNMESSVKSAWITALDKWYVKFIDYRNTIFESMNHIQYQIDSVAAFSRFVDEQLLAQRCDLAAAEVLLHIDENLNIVMVNQGKKITMKKIGESIEYRIPLSKKYTELLAESISLSLPGNKEVLPDIYVDTVSSGCSLKSMWKDPFDG